MRPGALPASCKPGIDDTEHAAPSGALRPGTLPASCKPGTGGNTAMKYKAFFDRDFSLSFDSKPPEAIRDMLKRNRFRWSPAAGRWGAEGARAPRISAPLLIAP